MIAMEQIEVIYKKRKELIIIKKIQRGKDKP